MTNKDKYFQYLLFIQVKTIRFIQDMKVISMLYAWHDDKLCAPILKAPTGRCLLLELGQRFVVSLQDGQAISKVKIGAS
jgi:hypothetical protein